MYLTVPFCPSSSALRDRHLHRVHFHSKCGVPWRKKIAPPFSPAGGGSLSTSLQRLPSRRANGDFVAKDSQRRCGHRSCGWDFVRPLATQFGENAKKNKTFCFGTDLHRSNVRFFDLLGSRGPTAVILGSVHHRGRVFAFLRRRHVPSVSWRQVS